MKVASSARNFEYILFLILLILPIIRAGLLPDELLTDDAEILEREKRDGFFERLFKTFPLFKQDEEKDEEPQDEIEFAVPEFVMPNLEVKLTEKSSSIPPILSTMRSSALFTSPTLKLQTSTQSMTPTMTQPSFFTSTPSLVTSTSRLNSTSSLMMTSTLSITKSSESTNMPSTSVDATSVVGSLSTTMQSPATLHISIPKATVFSSSINSSIQPTTSGKPRSSTYKSGPIYDLEFVLAAPRLPDEKGYGNVLGKEQIMKGEESREVKSTRFFISNLFVPIMSGLFGAFCISLVIMMIKCIRKRKLQKIRYYGGKPDTRLYGLDHMGLLSDMSSDEE